MAPAPEPRPGDVLVVQQPGPFGRLVSARLHSPWNHVAVVTHTDASGVLWVAGAQPSGVAQCSIEALGLWVSNAAQPKTDEQRAGVVAGVTSMLRMAYDWSAIERLAFARLEEQAGITWDAVWDGQRPPTHVICPMLAGYWYAEVGLVGPTDWRAEPPTWARFIEEEGWRV